MQVLTLNRMVLYYMPDPRLPDYPTIPVSAMVIEINPDTGNPTLQLFAPWGQSIKTNVPQVAGEDRCWRWDWPPRAP